MKSGHIQNTDNVKIIDKQANKWLRGFEMVALFRELLEKCENYVKNQLSHLKIKAQMVESAEMLTEALDEC
jgi:hypothetical protein